MTGSEESGIDHPLMPILKGVKRKAWYHNQMLFHRASEGNPGSWQAGIRSDAHQGRCNGHPVLS